MEQLPLRDVRVLEFGGYISGPYTSSLLCGLGADVVKVEKPEAGDPFRRGQNDENPYFAQFNAGKRSLAVDLKTTEGVTLIKRLVPRFDVVLENLRPGKMAALGLGAEDCRRLRPDLVYTSVSGFGEGGPMSARPAYDTIGQAFGGLYTLLGDESMPQLSGTIFADLITGLATTVGIVSALFARGGQGGRHVQTSLTEAISSLTIDAVTQYFEAGGLNSTRQTRHPQAQNFCVRTSSGEYIAIHLSSNEKFWLNLTLALARTELATDSRFSSYVARQQNYFELAEIVRDTVAAKSFCEWSRILTECDVPFAPVNSIGDFVDHPQVRWLELFEPPARGVALVRPPWRFDGLRPQRNVVAPRVGEHSREVAAEVYDVERVSQMISSGVLSTAREEKLVKTDQAG